MLGALKERLASEGMEVVAGTPEQYAEIIKADMQIMGRLIREAGIREN